MSKTQTITISGSGNDRCYSISGDDEIRRGQGKVFNITNNSSIDITVHWTNQTTFANQPWPPDFTLVAGTGHSFPVGPQHPTGTFYYEPQYGGLGITPCGGPGDTPMMKVDP